MDTKELIALKAVFYGCNTNKKLEDAYYFNRSTKERMSFLKALEIVGNMIAKEEEK